MFDCDESELGGVVSDEEAVEIVAEAFQNESPNAGQLGNALLQRLYNAHHKHLTRIARARLRRQGKTDDPEGIACDTITKFCKEVVPGFRGRLDSVAAYLTTMTHHACADCPGRPPPMVSARPADQVDTECLHYYAIMALPPNCREILLIDAGWHSGFNRWHGGPPRKRGDTPAVAEFLHIKPPAVARRRKRAREALERLKEVPGKVELIRIAFAAAMREVKRRPGKLGPWFFPPPISYYAVRLVRLADTYGLAQTTDLLRTAAELDFLGQPQEALRLADDLEKRTRGLGDLSPELWIETAMFMDHQARDLERERRLGDAINLVERGLKLLGHVMPANFDPHSQSIDGQIPWRALYQFGVLTRRAYELRQAQDPDNPAHACRLFRARAVFKRLLLRSGRLDHRIEAAHQDAVCDLLLNDVDEAEAGFRRCLAARDEYDNTERGRERLEETRFRRAYEHRRLSHVFARRAAAAPNDEDREAYYLKSLAEFKKTVQISADCGFIRYVLEVQQDARALLPEHYYHEIDSFVGQHV